MPFTLAHAAAALPFRRSRLIPSALVMGTLAPDFEYFLRLAPGGGFGHTFGGAFLLSLPLALIMLWIFHAIVKAPLVALFPDAMRLRLTQHVGRFRFGGPKRFVLIVASALIGIATHIAWDSFTHSYAWPYRHFEWLRQNWPVPWLGPVSVCEILQHVSTTVGILLLAEWLLRWYRGTEPCGGDRVAPLPAWRRWLIGGSIMGTAAVGGIYRAIAGFGGPAHNWEKALGDGAVTIIALAWWALVLYAVASRRRWFPIEA